MDIDQQQHFLQMRHAYIKRLRILELKEAQQGIDTQPHVISEIRELREKIIHVDMQLSGDNCSFSGDYSAIHDSVIVARRQVEIVLRGHFNKLTPEIQTAAIRALAAIMEIPYDQVTVMSIKTGSIVLHIEIPEQALKQLLGLYYNDDPVLRELEIIQIKVIDVPGEDSLNLTPSLLNQNQRIARLINQLDTVHGWNLSSDDQIGYKNKIINLVNKDINISDKQVESIIRNYHSNHLLFEEIINNDVLRRAWKDRDDVSRRVWVNQIEQMLRILSEQGLVGKSHVNSEDLAQEVLISISRELGKYQYKSRFSTWIYNVIARSMTHYYRNHDAGLKSVSSQALLDALAKGDLPSSSIDELFRSIMK